MSRKAIREYFRAIYWAISEGIKEIKAHNLGGVLFQHRIQSEICHPEIKWSSAWEARQYTPAAQETYL